MTFIRKQDVTISSTNLQITSGSNEITINTPVTLYKDFFSPESSQSGSVGDVYVDEGFSRLYFKVSGNSTTTGWAYFGPERVIYRSRFTISAANVSQELWVPWNNESDGTTLTFDHIIVMPQAGRIEAVTVVADQALNASCDVEVHTAADGSSTFSQLDTDLSMDLSTAYTVAQSNSIGANVSQFDKVAINFQSDTISVTTNVILTVEILHYGPL